MAGLKVLKVPAPAGGIDATSGPDYVPQTKATSLSNLLPGRAGKVQVRGDQTSTSLPGSSSPVTGLWRQGTRILVGRESGTWFWDLSNPTVAPQLMTTYYIESSYVGYADSVYGVPRMSATSLIRWYLDGTTETLDVMDQSPREALAITVHLDRLFVLGGSEPGTTTPITKRSLWWTDPLAGETLPETLDVWKNDASGLVNEIQLDGTDSDYGVGFARVNGSLVVLRRRSVNTLTGQTPENFSVRRIQAARGCTSTTSIAEYGGGCYYMSEDGLVWFDGSDSRVVSEAVNNYLLAQNRDLETAVVEVHPRDFLYVTVSTGPNVGAGTDRFLYHIPTSSWSTVAPTSLGTFSAWDGEALGPAFASYNTVSFGSISVPNVTEPAIDTVITAGVSSYAPITVTTVSRWISLSMPGEKAQLHRVIPSFSWETSTPGECPLQMAITGPGGQNDFVLAWTTLDAAYEEQWNRHRPVIECFAEVDDIQIWFRIDPEWTSALNALEIYDTIIEYAEARQRQP